MSIIYGPVPSWRLGKSLGIDLLNTKKTCSFNCIYCQLGDTIQVITQPKKFINLVQLGRELEAVRQIEADYATFSGMGEPTLASNLGEAIDMVKSALDLPIAVLTNSSLMSREDVRGELARADVVVAKWDASNEKLFATVNRPAPGLYFDKIIDGIRRFKKEYRGKLVLQIMFIEANRNYASEIATLAHDISPNEVQINTPLRPCGVKPLSPDNIAAIRDVFAKSVTSLSRDRNKRDEAISKRDSFPPIGTGFRNVVTVYEAPSYDIVPLDLVETLRRRPKL